MKEESPMNRTESLQRIVDLCSTGFQSYDRSQYVEIERIADELGGDDPEIVKIKRLAGAGPTLSSPRFAYPHIEDAAREALAKVNAE
jgi:hypothetical protein